MCISHFIDEYDMSRFYAATKAISFANHVAEIAYTEV